MGADCVAVDINQCGGRGAVSLADFNPNAAAVAREVGGVSGVGVWKIAQVEGIELRHSLSIEPGAGVQVPRAINRLRLITISHAAAVSRAIVIGRDLITDLHVDGCAYERGATALRVGT
jgi:hypothetical protein